ncbi:DUF6036 family nucleotidyltransferase [Mycobacteroides salmoniphilum]|uniref:DUF6036 domain-containing protein n=1 Tax=Mycobacteroides salmoniphilum TaxID=404941 RepID=A0A4R8T001_9MYCO|nr:DUF6036 family nucleotidyltransferase [Mycobacteroides salmoniphilum]TEA09141.1 hypothetical protein CCUG60884_00310 [Mycobacteroides salmoniphilum]
MDLWSSAQVAAHFGVTAGRARQILGSRGIRRLSGYPAAAVRTVQLRQGARTDLHPTDLDVALSIDDAAQGIQAAAAESDKLRVFFEFLRGTDAAGPGALQLLEPEPRFTGDTRFDALLAAAAERLCSRYGLPAPLWTATPERFLQQTWWVSDMPSARPLALMWTPPSFHRRGIYLDAYDLPQDGKAIMPEPVFGESEIRAAFALLAAKLQKQNVIGQVHVIGGAAMLLTYNSRTVTRDIDAIFSPDGPVVDAVRQIAHAKGWPSTWLNNQASVYASRTPGQGAVVFDHPHLQVMTTPAEHLLAMKVLAARPVRDREDATILVQHLNISTPQGVWDIVGRYFPEDMISPRSRLFVEDLFDFIAPNPPIRPPM